MKVRKLDTHSDPLQTMPDHSNGTIELAIGTEAQPQFDLLSGWRGILSLNENTNRTDIRPAGSDLFVALFEVNVIDQFDPFMPTAVGRNHEVPQGEKQ